MRTPLKGVILRYFLQIVKYNVSPKQNKPKKLQTTAEYFALSQVPSEERRKKIVN